MDVNNKYLKYKTKYLEILKGGANKDRTFYIGIGGASGCGKTYFATTIKKNLDKVYPGKVEIISCDNYYNSHPGNKRAPPDYNWDLPSTLDLKLLAKHLIELKNGKKIEVPKFNFVTSQREGIDKIIDGSKIKIIIVEGLFVLYDKNLRENFDLKIFTLLDPDICLARRLNRDVSERGASYEETIMRYQKDVKPAYANYIEPTKIYSDIIISTSEYTNTNKSVDIINNYIVSKLKK